MSADMGTLFSETLCFLFFIFVCDIHRVRSGYHNEKMKKRREALVFILLPLQPGHSRNNCSSGWDGYFQCCLDILATSMYTGWICISAYLDVAYFLICNIIANWQTQGMSISLCICISSSTMTLYYVYLLVYHCGISDMYICLCITVIQQLEVWI